MKQLKIRAVTLGALVAVAAAVGSAGAATATLTANFAGRVVVIASADSGELTVSGKGAGTVVGKGLKIAAKGAAYDGNPCATFFGTGTITAADGATIKFKGLNGSKVCKSGDDARNAINAKVTVTGGTKRFAKAKGTLTVTGNYNRTAGTYAAKFTGKLSY